MERPKVMSNLETLLEVCRSVADGTKPKIAENTLKEYIRTLEVFGFVKRCEDGVKLLEAGKHFLSLARSLGPNKAFLKAILDYDNVKPIISALLTVETLSKDKDKDVRWIALLRNLNLIDKNNRLTHLGRRLLDAEIEKIVNNWLKDPRSTAGKIHSCPFFVFNDSSADVSTINDLDLTRLLVQAITTSSQ